MAALKDLKMDYRTTKEVVERICLNSFKWSNFEGKRIFANDLMYLGISKDGVDCYELKVTSKKERIDECNEKLTTDSIKNEYLALLKETLGILFPRLNYHNGALILNDDLKDYSIILVKKKLCKWTK